MREDIERWDRKYAERVPEPDPAPDPLLVERAALLRPPRGGGDALDVACGEGGNALYLARTGYRVTGVDGSLVALRRARAAARRGGLHVWFLAADLDRFAPAPASADLVVLVRYLNRALVPRLVRALRPGGLLVCKTFNRLRLRERPGFNPAYLLEPGETAMLFADLEPVAGNDSNLIREPLTWWIGRRR